LGKEYKRTNSNWREEYKRNNGEAEGKSTRELRGECMEGKSTRELTG
jgi:hypothetical protein